MKGCSFHQNKLQPVALLFAYWNDRSLSRRSDGWHFPSNFNNGFELQQQAGLSFEGKTRTGWPGFVETSWNCLVPWTSKSQAHLRVTRKPPTLVDTCLLCSESRCMRWVETSAELELWVRSDHCSWKIFTKSRVKGIRVTSLATVLVQPYRVVSCSESCLRHYGTSRCTPIPWLWNEVPIGLWPFTGPRCWEKSMQHVF